MNQLYYGDNLTFMRDKMKSSSVDLIYLDPPFNSNRNYNLLYKTATGVAVPEQEEAFCDTWELTETKAQTLRNIEIIFDEHGIPKDALNFWRLWIDALRNTQPKLLAYLVYMAYRLLEMRRILRPTASHYIKVTMDAIFGHTNFRNEIVWYYDGPQRPSKKNFGKKHDIILRYSKSDRFFASPDGIAPMRKLSEDELCEYKQTGDGRYYYDLPRGDYTDQSIQQLDKEGRIYWTKNGNPRVMYFLTQDERGNHYRKLQP